MNRTRDPRDQRLRTWGRWLGLAAALGSLVSLAIVQPRCVVEVALLLAAALWLLLRPVVRRVQRARCRRAPASARLARG